MRNYFYWWLILMLFIARLDVSRSVRESTKDYMMHLQCQAKCLKVGTKACHDQCYADMKMAKKFGTCPCRVPREAMSNESLWMENQCIDTCSNWDYNCPEAEKCCPNTCGSTCQRPSDLDRIKALPPMPTHLSLMNSQFRKVELCWNLYTNKNKTLFFVIEGRSHVGMVFTPHKLNDWAVFIGHPRYDHVFWDRQVEVARRCCFILKVKPGRWYQFRVASLNENGTRGFSRASSEFQLKESKAHKVTKPPRNVTIGPLYLEQNDGKEKLMTTKVSWLAPKSSIHVDKYKVFWSLHLPGAMDSLTIQQATVYEPHHSFELRHLVPDSTYYVQVQAISVFGQRRLKSKKESRLLNTTLSEALPTPMASRMRHGSRGAGHLMIRFIMTRHNELLVRITWPNANNFTNFQLELCRGNGQCLDKVHLGEYRTVNTTRTSFEFVDLKFHTQYTVRLKSFHNTANPDQHIVSKTFQIPSCEVFKRRHSAKLLKCHN